MLRKLTIAAYTSKTVQTEPNSQGMQSPDLNRRLEQLAAQATKGVFRPPFHLIVCLLLIAPQCTFSVMHGWYWMLWFPGAVLLICICNAVFGQYPLRNEFRENYQQTLLVLHGSSIALFIADPGLIPSGAELFGRESGNETTATSETLETRLRLASKYFDELLRLERGSLVEQILQEDGNSYLRYPTSWLYSGIAGIHGLLVDIGLPLPVLRFGASVKLTSFELARLTAMCDFYLDRETKWLNGWNMDLTQRKYYRNLVEGWKPVPVPPAQEIAPGPFDLGALAHMQQRRLE